MNKILEKLIARESYDPLGEDRELIERIYTVSKPRDFEKLKLTDAQCDQLLGRVEDQALQGESIRPIPAKLVGLKPRIATLVDNFI